LRFRDVLVAQEAVKLRSGFSKGMRAAARNAT
jgi:hypothetical protein